MGCFLSLLCRQYLSGFYCLPVWQYSVCHLYTPPFIYHPYSHLAVGGMDANRRQKSPGNKMFIYHRGSSSSPAFLRQAASVCVSAAAYNPLGGRWRLKRLGWACRSCCNFLAFCCSQSVVGALFCWAWPSQFLNSNCNGFFLRLGYDICYVAVMLSDLGIPVLDQRLSIAACSIYFFNPLKTPRPQLFTPGKEGARLCGPNLCCLLSSLKLVGICFTL